MILDTTRVAVVDLAAAKVTAVLKGDGRSVFSVAFSRDGQRAFSGSSRDRTILQWDLKTGKEVRRSHGGDRVESLAIAPDEQRFLTTEFKAVQEWDVKSGERLRALTGHEARVHGVVYSSDGQTIITKPRSRRPDPP